MPTLLFMQNWLGLEIIGKDARDFLQRLTTLPVSKYSSGDGARGLLLNPMAKAFGSFTLLCLAAQRFVLIFETEEEFTRVKEEFERLHFAENLEMRALGGEGGVLQEKKSLPSFVCEESGNFFWRWFLDDRVAAFGKNLPALLSFEDMESERIELGESKWGAEFGPEVNVLDAGLFDRLPGNKGCYPGQEVVERSLSVGHPARAMIQVRGECELGAALSVEGKDVGKITSVSPRGVYALAIVQWKYREEMSFDHQGRKIIRCHK